VNKQLVYGRMTGWGQEGPWRGMAGHDICYIAVTGALHAIGRAGSPPVPPLSLAGDLGGGALYLVSGVLAALHETARSGTGQVVDAAIVDGAASLMTPFYGQLARGEFRDERGANEVDSGRPWYDVYETADGSWMAIGAIEDRFYREAMSRLGIPAGEARRDDPAAWPALRERIARAFKTRRCEEWIGIFFGTDSCVAPVLSMKDAPASSHLSARATFVKKDGVAQPAPAPRFSRTTTHAVAAPKRRGADTEQTLLSWGLHDIRDLLSRGVVRQWANDETQPDFLMAVDTQQADGLES
jgi:alpha-methylacyl-CoA racemase